MRTVSKTIARLGPIALVAWAILAGSRSSGAAESAASFQLQGWRYTTERPPDGWEREDFDDSGWKEGQPGFGNQGLPPLQQARVKTPWNEPEIWTRARLDLERVPEDIAIRWSHDEDAEVYVNGVLAISANGFIVGYEVARLENEARKSLRPGKNVIAAHCRQTVGGQFLDVSFVEAKPRERRSVESVIAELPRPAGVRVQADASNSRPKWTGLRGGFVSSRSFLETEPGLCRPRMRSSRSTETSSWPLWPSPTSRGFRTYSSTTSKER